ncbi:hypothetical protein FXW78_46230 [Rhodococcus opacus]|nr:hypothetical protein [Rhodococcus opacus]
MIWSGARLPVLPTAMIFARIRWITPRRAEKPRHLQASAAPQWCGREHGDDPPKGVVCVDRRSVRHGRHRPHVAHHPVRVVDLGGDPRVRATPSAHASGGRPVDRRRFVELVQTALERAATSRHRVGVIHVSLQTPTRGPGPRRATRRLTGQVTRLRRSLGPGDVLGCLGPADYALLHTGPVGELVSAANRTVAHLAPAPDGLEVTVSAAIAVDTSEDAAALIRRAGAPGPPTPRQRRTRP